MQVTIDHFKTALSAATGVEPAKMTPITGHGIGWYGGEGEQVYFVKPEAGERLRAKLAAIKDDPVSANEFHRKGTTAGVERDRLLEADTSGDVVGSVTFFKYKSGLQVKGNNGVIVDGAYAPEKGEYTLTQRSKAREGKREGHTIGTLSLVDGTYTKTADVIPATGFASKVVEASAQAVRHK